MTSKRSGRKRIQLGQQRPLSVLGCPPNVLPFTSDGRLQCSHKTPGRGMQIQPTLVPPSLPSSGATAGWTGRRCSLGSPSKSPHVCPGSALFSALTELVFEARRFGLPIDDDAPLAPSSGCSPCRLFTAADPSPGDRPPPAPDHHRIPQDRPSSKTVDRAVICPTFCRSAVNADGRERSYHGREEPRAPARGVAAQPALERAAQAFSRCNGLLGGVQASGISGGKVWI